MSAERVIGVDFGTSTSVIRVKRYQDGNPIGDPLFVQPVTFNMGNTMVPTLIQRAGQETYYGFEAQVPRKNSRLFQNFKVELESNDPSIQCQAKELTAEFIKYLYDMYQNQREHLGEMDDMERTIISYPVKWSNETKNFLIDAMEQAGFPNVEGMDEAQAAIQTITVQNADYLRQRGYFQSRAAVNILLIDMGAGTTDLVLCRHTPVGTEILCTWPKEGEILFGGKEVDLLLWTYIKSKIPPEEAAVVMKRCGVEKVKAWKETMVSPALKKKEQISEFNEVDIIVDILGISMEDYTLDRMAFETMADDYLRKLALLVNNCLKFAGLQGKDIDLVIPTGGHSQWYFVREMLSGQMKQFGMTSLEKIQKDPGRIIPIALPQETVALGLVYKPLHVTQEALTHVEMEPPTCTEAGHVEYWLRESDGACLLDPLGNTQTEKQNTILLALGHDYHLVTDGNKRMERCARCGMERPVKTETPPQQPTPPAQDEPTPETEFELGNIGEGYKIIKYLGNRSRVVIPESIRGRKVVSIGKWAFAGRNNLLKNNTLSYVEIPKTIKVIEAGAFAFCAALKYVKMHNQIEEFGNAAFCGSNNIDYFDFGEVPPLPKVLCCPKALKIVGRNAFTNSWSGKCYLREVTISKHTKVGNMPLAGKTFDCAVFYYEDQR